MAHSGSVLAKDFLVKELAASMRTGQQAEVELMERLRGS
jgi:hypothetical protein